MAKKIKSTEDNTLVTLNKRYQFGTGKNSVILEAGEEVEVTPEQLANIDKKDIVRDEEKN